jgi:uncharacterized membrane protein
LRETLSVTKRSAAKVHLTEAEPIQKEVLMAVAMMSWLLAIPLLGLTTGLRTFTPMAVLCWFAWLGYLPVDGTWAAWTGKFWIAVVFTVLAVGELIGDKLPRTPNRTAPGPLLARLVFGGLGGAICATGMNGPGLEGALLGVVGALLGSFGGFMVRRDIVDKLGCADWPIALAEDVFAILAACFSVHVVTG